MNMISVNEARALVEKTVLPVDNWERISVAKGINRVLYETVNSPINMPPFRQSAMDGYAICVGEHTTYTIAGEVKAGDSYHPTLKKGEAFRIFTGAPVPNTANAVIMQEKVRVANNRIQLESEVCINENIRPIGEQVSRDEVALKKGSVLTPAAIGYLTTLGITEVNVYRKPNIAIVITGNELAPPGQNLKHGQIYESNAQMLTAALLQMGHSKVSHYKVSDNYPQTVKVLNNVIRSHDLVLVSGGISVGDYDFVGKALDELGVTEHFYKVKQKPGKPLFFGSKEGTMIFALPGNPASALSCFYMYVYTALQIRTGHENYALPIVTARSLSHCNTKGDRVQFLKAIYKNGTVEILEGQSSAMLHTFALSNALVRIPEVVDVVEKDDPVAVILLPIN